MSDLDKARTLLAAAERDFRALRGMSDPKVFADESAISAGLAAVDGGGVNGIEAECYRCFLFILSFKPALFR